MKHEIPIAMLGPRGPSAARAVEACVHCGFCLPTCPTYRVLGEEADSPRGRIVLMKEGLEGGLGVKETLGHLDRCLGCLACVTACPSGVEYGQLLSSYRFMAEEARSRPRGAHLARILLRETLPHPRRLRWAVRLGRLARPVSALVPSSLRPMLALLPDSLPPSRPLPALYPAEGPRRARVAFLEGCVQRVLAPDVNWATLRVLARNGVEVVVPPGQGCCGALDLHMGEERRGVAQARHNLDHFPSDVDAVVTNAAGCGSAMKEYGEVLAGSPDAGQAVAFAQRVRDVSELLWDLGLVPPPGLRQPAVVAYHDACHLAHGQRVRAQPRDLLGSIPNVRLVEIPDGEICCGSAGVYNIEQSGIADELGKTKAANVMRSGGQVVASGNIGCIVQLRRHLRQADAPIRAYHTVELLDIAYRDGVLDGRRAPG